ncbi:hypothetical protein R3P38DRAFT_3255117 [Favolaschia claudopus]|uniref:Uncharacterized protein n=1 Tax=Favolaschia claudopus TaxID=2862362 RepID=A0AAW0DFZ9_9AGAR
MLLPAHFRASAHSNFSSSASTARLDLLTDSSDERTDYVSQRNSSRWKQVPTLTSSPSTATRDQNCTQRASSKRRNNFSGLSARPRPVELTRRHCAVRFSARFWAVAAPAILLNRISTYRISISTSLYRAESSAHRLSAAQRPHPKLWRCKHVPVQHKDSLAAPPSSLMWRIYLRPRHTPRKSQATAAVFPLPHPLYSTLAYFRVEPVTTHRPDSASFPHGATLSLGSALPPSPPFRRRRHPAPPTPRPSGIYIKTPTPFRCRIASRFLHD